MKTKKFDIGGVNLPYLPDKAFSIKKYPNFGNSSRSNPSSINNDSLAEDASPIIINKGPDRFLELVV